MAHILLAEDNALNQRLYCDILTRSGYQVTAVGDGEAAIRSAADLRPDLILMDLQLPLCSGHSALRTLRADPAFSELPVIAVSAFAHRDDREKALANGFSDFISKPVSIDGLLDMVSHHLGADCVPISETRAIVAEEG